METGNVPKGRSAIIIQRQLWTLSFDIPPAWHLHATPLGTTSGLYYAQYTVSGNAQRQTNDALEQSTYVVTCVVLALYTQAVELLALIKSSVLEYQCS